MLTVLKVIGMIILVIVVLYLLMIMPRMINRPDFTPFQGRLYAHRGLHDNETNAPENSLNAFQKAVDAGYGIELDVQLTKDEKMVVCHDFDLKRICGADVKVRDLTFEELQGYHICKSDQTIPTFEEVLRLIDGKVPLIIEYKVPGMSAKVCEMADALLQDYKGLYCVESFHPLAVLWYRRNRKEIVRGILSDSYIKEGMTDMPKVVYGITHHMLVNFLISPDFIAYHHSIIRICRALYVANSITHRQWHGRSRASSSWKIVRMISTSLFSTLSCQKTDRSLKIRQR